MSFTVKVAKSKQTCFMYTQEEEKKTTKNSKSINYLNDSLKSNEIQHQTDTHTKRVKNYELCIVYGFVECLRCKYCIQAGFCS